MKKLRLSLTVIACASFVATAQINTNPPPTAESLPATVMDYFTSFNPNLETTFHDNRGLFWTGVDSVRGGQYPLLNEFGGSYDFLQPSHSPTNTSTAIFLEGVERNGGILSTVTSVQGGLGFALIVHDVRLSLSGDFGYTLDANNVPNLQRMYGEVDFRAMKAVGPHFAFGVGSFVQFPSKAQGLFALATATF